MATLREIQEETTKLNDTVKNKKMNPGDKLAALGSVSSSFSSMRRSFAMASGLPHQEGLVMAANFGAHIASMAETLETFSLLDKAKDAPSLLTMTSALNMVSTGLSLLTSLMGPEEGGLGEALGSLSDLLMEGFETVLQTLADLREEMHQRFDRLEGAIDHSTYTLELGVLELLHQGKSLETVIGNMFEKQARDKKEIVDRLGDLGSSLSTTFSLVTSSMAAFRHEGLYKLLTQIRYWDETGLLTRPKLHEVIGELYGVWLAVGKSPHVTGYGSRGAEAEGVLALLNGLDGNGWEDLIGLICGKPVAHPIILKGVEGYMGYLTQKLEEAGEAKPFHHSIIQEMVDARDEIKEALRNPLLPFLPDPDLSLIHRGKMEDLVKDAGMQARHYLNSERDTAIAHLRKVLTHNLFDFFKEEMTRLSKSHAGQIDGGVSTPCKAGLNVAKLAFVDGYHTKIPAKLTRILGKCKASVRSSYYGIFCGWFGIVYLGHSCFSKIDKDYRVTDVYVGEGLEEGTVKDFLEKNPSLSFYEDEIKDKLYRHLGMMDPTSPFLMAHVSIKDQVFFLPFSFSSPMSDLLLEHGYVPTLNLSFTPTSIQAYLVIEDASATQPYKRQVWASSLVSIDHFLANHVYLSILSPTDLLLWFFLGGFSLHRFGFTWNTTCTWTRKHLETWQIRYTLGLKEMPSTFEEVCSLAVRDLLTLDVTDRFVEKRKDEMAQTLKESRDGCKDAIEEDVRTKVMEGLEALRKLYL